MRLINCTGPPYEIGLRHGSEAQAEIKRGLIFYEALFQKMAKLPWPQVCSMAEKFEPMLRRDWAGYCEEMEGIAKGAQVPYLSILALNVRTEIAYGMSQDGCTALSWKTESSSFLAQNWDWQEEQQENLIRVCITQVGKPTIGMVTEAGIIGKIGLNSSGVGVCLNAIRALGVDFEKLPCHLALRSCLDATRREDAVAILEKAGVASSCHILLADPTGGVGMECSHLDIVQLPMDTESTVRHTNHYIKSHAGVEDKIAFADSPVRLGRIDELVREQTKKLDGDKVQGFDIIRSMLKDEKNSPPAICRSRTADSSVATLFSIVMDLTRRHAEVTIGKPNKQGAVTLSLDPKRLT